MSARRAARGSPPAVARVAQEYEPDVVLDRLKPHPENPRRGQVGAILASIEAHGFYGCVVAQRSTGHVLAGNHRLLAALEAGMVSLPVFWLDVDDDEARRILLADNRSSDMAGYDDEALAELLGLLEASEAGLTGTLFDTADPADARVLGYARVDTSQPLTRAHYLVSYPLDAHGRVMAAIDPLGDDERIRIRHATTTDRDGAK